MARVLVVNPGDGPRRRKGRKMARKQRKRRKHRKNPRRKHRRVHHKKRRHVANPRKRRSHGRRKHRKNPGRRRRHRVSGHVAKRGRRRYRVRGHMSNPRRRGRRRHRRNPGIPMWAQAAIAAVVGIGVYAIVSDGAFAITQRTDPSMNTLPRNRYILGGLAVAAGLGLVVMGKPLYGAAIAAAGAVGSGLGTQASLALGKVLDKPLATTQTTKGIGAVYAQNLSGMGAVYAQNLSGMGAYRALGAYQPMGAVYSQSMRGLGSYTRMGDFVPNAPWQSVNPF